MSSKQLQSILKNIPSATANGENITQRNMENSQINSKKLDEQNVKTQEKTDRVVAEIPRDLKRQIKRHLENNEGMTERGLILKALKLYGFDIDENWIMDKRTTR